MLAVSELYCHQFYRAVWFRESTAGLPGFVSPLAEWLADVKAGFYGEEIPEKKKKEEAEKAPEAKKAEPKKAAPKKAEAKEEKPAAEEKPKKAAKKEEKSEES